ncbi:hypothetical protein GCM10022198_09620 [Klugiella xanthotipulae]|uniref:Uncharacterized protein n=1 Tax=Klugiella xanthotipulae TaxID=244735 RepID=A0A543I6Z5_9MICO|nr:ABC transporter ATP-binding protein [Klugiella xanthotipulae]TQM66260.1 hypothetical protein FB466_1097 [Klugiella xanthotipulae]
MTLMPPTPSHEPSKRDRLKPVELVGFAAILAIFAGLISLMSTRQIELALIFAGGAFIVTLVLLALLGMGMKPNDLEKRDIDAQDRDDAGGGH